MEGLPRPCFAGASAGRYAKKHDPFAYYRPIARQPADCAHVVPLTQLTADERGHALPRFIWITPNLCHDMHDCSPAVGDRFLSHLVPPLLASLGHRGILILTWDEGTSDEGCCRLASGGHVVTIVAGPGARRGAELRTPTDHYSTLQTVEDLLGLGRLRGAACPCTPSLAPLLAGRARARVALATASWLRSNFPTAILNKVVLRAVTLTGACWGNGNRPGDARGAPARGGGLGLSGSGRRRLGRGPPAVPCLPSRFRFRHLRCRCRVRAIPPPTGVMMPAAFATCSRPARPASTTPPSSRCTPPTARSRLISTIRHRSTRTLSTRIRR